MSIGYRKVLPVPPNLPVVNSDAKGPLLLSSFDMVMSDRPKNAMGVPIR